MSTITHVVNGIDLNHVAKNIVLTNLQPQLDSMQTTINNILNNTDEVALNSLKEIVDKLTSDKSLYATLKSLSDSNLAKLNQLTTALEQEITRAKSAENLVSSNLTTKEQQLSNAINSEIQSRQNADTAIQTEITNKHDLAISTLNTKASALQSMDASLQTSVSSLQQADTVINNEIAGIKTRNEGQDEVKHELLKKLAPSHFAPENN